MKPIQNQYQDLLEGKMSKSNFLTNVKRSLSDYVSNITSFDDAVKILKSKRILSEVQITKEVFDPANENALEKIVSKYVKDTDDIDKEMEAYHNQGYKGFSDMLKANLSRDEEFQTWTEYTKDKEQYKKEVGESKLNEDWGSSDQATFNKAIHDELGQPKEMPMPFDPKFEAAVESAVDFWWDEWDEYATDREGLIDHAKKAYYRAYFPEKFSAFQEMFSEGNLSEQKVYEKLDTDSYIRMDGLVPQRSLSDLVKGAGGIIKALKDDGFDEEDIFDYIVDNIKTLDDNSQDQAMVKRYDQEQDAKHTLPGGNLRESIDMPANIIADIDKVNPLEYRAGIDYELDLSGDFSAESLLRCAKKVVKNLKKDAIYYTNLKANVTEKINKKQTDASKSVEIKKDNHIDKLNNLKTLVKKELANTKISLTKKEKATKVLPKGVKLMKEEEQEKFDLNKYNKDNFKKQAKEFSNKLTKPVTQKNTLKDKIKEYITKQLKKEAIKFTVAGDHEYKNPKDAPEFEKELKSAGVRYTKTNI